MACRLLRAGMIPKVLQFCATRCNFVLLSSRSHQPSAFSRRKRRRGAGAAVGLPGSHGSSAVAHGWAAPATQLSAPAIRTATVRERQNSSDRHHPRSASLRARFGSECRRFPASREGSQAQWHSAPSEWLQLHVRHYPNNNLIFRKVKWGKRRNSETPKRKGRTKGRFMGNIRMKDERPWMA
jgi:hypothetical protein